MSVRSLDAEDLVRPAQLATYLQLSRSTLADWRLKGSGPKWFYIHGRVYYYRADIDQWLEDCGRDVLKRKKR